MDERRRWRWRGAVFRVGRRRRPSASARIVMVAAIGLCGFGSGAGCRHVGRVEIEGRSAFRFIQPAPPPGVKASVQLAVADASQRYIPARAKGELTRPIYPAAARGKVQGPVTVGVRITVDVDGRVSEVATSLAVFSTPGPWAEEFRVAVEEALAAWRFEPAELLQLETVSDPQGDFQRVKVRERVEAFAEVVFTFTATGKVEAG